MWWDLWKIQCKEQGLGTLETKYLVEMNNVELVSKGNGKKNLQKWENFPFFDFKKYH